MKRPGTSINISFPVESIRLMKISVTIQPAKRNPLLKAVKNPPDLRKEKKNELIPVRAKNKETKNSIFIVSGALSGLNWLIIITVLTKKIIPAMRTEYRYIFIGRPGLFEAR
jgi:hypothetical protein